MKIYAIGGTTLKWFENYLTETIHSDQQYQKNKFKRCMWSFLGINIRSPLIFNICK